MGDWFAVPLADGSFAPVDHVPTVAAVSSLEPGNALCAARMSGVSIGDCWPLLGGAGQVDLAVWQIPEG